MSRSIVVNTRALAHRLTGVERYTNELTNRLKGKVSLISPTIKLNGGLGHVWEQLELPRKINPGDILWSPANTGPLSIPNQVVTIHDLSPLEHPEWFSPSFATWYAFLIPRLVHRVRLLLTISEFTKNRILDRLSIPEERVVIVRPGIDMDKFHPLAGAEKATQPRSAYLPERYILFVGSLEPRKNLERLVRAWQLLQSSPAGNQHEVELVLAGVPGKPFRPLNFEAWPKGIHRLGYIEEADLPAIYAGAMAFILPSLYEGFGLTVLEAMACGVPVLVSKDTALAETSEGVAVLFDPLSVDDIASVLCTVIGDEKQRQRMRLQGLEHVRDFSWDRAADKVFEVIHACD